MSVNRVLTRLAVVSALNNFMSQPWPTLAGPNIFDSKIEPVEDMKQDRVFPCCVVYTDYDKDHWNKGAGAHKDRLLTVTLELLIVQASKVDGAGAQVAYQLDCPATDSEIETSLDFFEAQCFRALNADNPAAEVFNHLCPTYANVVSRRGASIEGGQRLAARQITLEMKTSRDQVTGPLNPMVAAFLTRLESFEDYAERVDEIRSFLTFDPGETAGELLSRTFGYPKPMLDILGTPRVAGGVLPPTISYHYQGGLSP